MCLGKLTTKLNELLYCIRLHVYDQGTSLLMCLGKLKTKINELLFCIRLHVYDQGTSLLMCLGKLTTKLNELLYCIRLHVYDQVPKKESRLKFYRMSFALHSIDICIFFMLQIYH